MLFADAQKEIERASHVEYRVSFEWHRGCMLESDRFPDCTEPGFTSEQEAWCWAQRFARVPDVVNIYVIGNRFCPVAGYQEKMLNIYPPS
jgi:hypothetical protein